jgi:hypothetical protein
MKQGKNLAHEFVEFIPDVVEEGKLYVSIEYATVVHKCCCGCGKEVVTPLSPADWRLIFDGKTISLDPSIGNWSFPCRSHYCIKDNRVRWAEDWSQSRIDATRTHDRWAKEKYFGEIERSADLTIPAQRQTAAHPVPSRKDVWWKRLWPW